MFLDELPERVRSRIVVDESGCWIWQGACEKTPDGRRNYGHIHIEKPRRTTTTISRYILGIKLGRPVERGMEACHTCHRPPCCSPEHLYEGTQEQNNRDSAEHCGRAKRLTRNDVETILTLVETVSQRGIANRYRVSPAAISNIVTGRTWRQVPRTGRLS